MDLFGKSLYDYYYKNPKPLFFQIGDNKFERDLRPYFRNSVGEFCESELFAYSTCKGKTLDVGCGTCNYHFLINCDLVGIDSSTYCTKIATQLGTKCINNDIFSYMSTSRFETVAFFGNSVGLGGTLNKTLCLLNILKDVLASHGTIVALQKEIKSDYEILPINLEYGSITQRLDWMSFNSGYLCSLGNSLGLDSRILFKDKFDYIIKFSKSFKQQN